MVKQKLTLSVDSEVIEQARIKGINLSDTLEKCLMKSLNLRKVSIEYAEECEKPCKDVIKHIINKFR